jgi:hypothetical protein
MCQKAFGSAFAPLAGVALQDFAWLRGEPGIYRSSEVVERGFCRECGTPLSFRYSDKDRISISLGSLDEPSRVAPERQYGAESRLAWIDRMHLLPSSRTEDDVPPDRLARYKSRQHPDQPS